MSFNKEGLGFNPNNQKRLYKHFFIKETLCKEPQSRSGSRNNKFDSNYQSHTVYQRNHNYFGIGIQVTVDLVKFTTTIGNSVVKRPLA